MARSDLPQRCVRRAGGDFLAVRSATGALALRELTGTLAVGQQEPHMRVPPPSSRDVKCAARTWLQRVQITLQALIVSQARRAVSAAAAPYSMRQKDKESLQVGLMLDRSCV